jgi:DNA-binding transcriptional ArsR family regulator
MQHPSQPSVTDLVAQHLKVLGHPMRIKLIEQLQIGPAAVYQLVATVGGTQQNISEHLLILYQAGIVSRNKHGRSVRYHLVDPHVVQAVDRARESVAHRLNELARLIEIE